MKLNLLKSEPITIAEMSDLRLTENNYLYQLAEIQNKLLSKANSEFESKLKGYLIANLKQLGFEFKDDAEFLEFISKRVSKISTNRNPNDFEFWLDFTTENQKLIGLCNTEINFNYEGNTASVVIGRVLDKPKTFTE